MKPSTILSLLIFSVSTALFSSCILTHNITMVNKTIPESGDSSTLHKKTFNVMGVGVLRLTKPSKLTERVLNKVAEEEMVGMIYLTQTNRDWFGIVQSFNITVTGESLSAIGSSNSNNPSSPRLHIRIRH